MSIMLGKRWFKKRQKWDCNTTATWVKKYNVLPSFWFTAKEKSKNQKLHSLLPSPPLPPVIQVIKSWICKACIHRLTKIIISKKNSIKNGLFRESFHASHTFQISNCVYLRHSALLTLLVQLASRDLAGLKSAR